MGLFGRQHQTAKKKRTATSSVGIAEQNDLGSFSGLEVDIDCRIDKEETDTERGRKTASNKTKKPTSGTPESIFRVAGFFFRNKSRRNQRKQKRKQKRKRKGSHRGRVHEESHRPLPVNQTYSSSSSSNYGGCNSSGSNDLSIYTSGANVNENGVSGNSNSTSTTTTTAASDGIFVTLDHVPDLVLDLDTAVVVSAKRPIRALKMLMALSSSAASSIKSVHDARIEMVHSEHGKLVLVLLSFLNRCMVQSKEHTLALLLLSNLSIPQENKTMIALGCKGVEILARLLCEDPSSHLVALVLVNLTHNSSPESDSTTIEVTVADANIDSNNDNKNNSKIDVIHCDSDKSSLRKELLATNGNTALVESLAFALRVSSLTQDEYDHRKETIEDCNYFSEDYLSPATRLSILMAKDQQLRSSGTDATPIGLRSRLQLHRQKVLPATASPDQILRQLRLNEQELQKWGIIDGTIVVERSNCFVGDTICQGGRSDSKMDAKQVHNHPPPMVEPSKQIYPKTAKWCLVALRNLTKPCNCDATAAHMLIKSGIFSLVVQYITTSTSSTSSSNSNRSGASSSSRNVARMGISPMEESSSPPCLPTNIDLAVATNHQIDNNFLSASYGKRCSRNVVGARSNTGMSIHGGDDDTIDCGLESRRPTILPLMLPSVNSPYLWEANSMQDAALSIVLNLSASCKSREYMNEPHIVKVLSMIAECPNSVGKMRKSAQTISQEGHETMNFQALKARMALSYLIGSQGHFGQTKLRSSASTVKANRADSSLVMSDSDVMLLVELFANVMNHRGKVGSGGGNYLSETFDLKYVILSLRCLLTHTSNQERITKLLGLELNSLLINALARHALEPSSSPIDSESSGHIAFSLYLLSNHGFEGLPFLPKMYGKQQHHRHRRPSIVDHGLAANVLVSYLRISNIPPEGRHAARQLLLRLDYLNFENRTSPDARTTCRRTLHNVVRLSDLKINYILLAKIKRVRIVNRKHGSKPDPAIFNRPVLRYQKPRNYDENNRLLSMESNKKKHQKNITWSNLSTASTFANALVAIQHLSYGSIKVRRSFSESIDDVAIANAIACSARHETSGGCYNFLWAWRDAKLKKDCSYGSQNRCPRRQKLDTFQ